MNINNMPNQELTKSTNNRVKNLIKSKVALAPMAGITDLVLRNLVRDYSKNCLLYTEMISSEALNQVRETDMIQRREDHSPIVYQLSGHKPEMMAKAAKIVEPFADMIDINMGCPVNKVVKGQDGSALMRNPDLAASLVKSIKDAVNLPVSVKFRLGYTVDEMNFIEYGQQMQEAGAEFIIIHARTRSQMYSGKADWSKIKMLKNNVDIPVFANGDITSPQLAQEALEISGADGIAVGRGVLGDVTLLHRIEEYLNHGIILPEPTLEEKLITLRKHLDGEIELRGELFGMNYARKFYAYYIGGIKNAAKYRYRLVTEQSYDNVLKIMQEILDSSVVSE